MKITDEALFAAARDAREQWLASYPDPAPHHAFSTDFERKIKKLADHPHRRVRLRTLLIAAVIAALTTMTVGAEVLPPVRAFHSGVVHVLSQVLPKSTDQIYTTDADHEGPTRRPVLGWLPEGMVETRKSEQPEYTHLNFENSSNEWVIVSVRRITEDSGNTSSFDTEDAQVNEIKINGITATISVKKETAVLIYFIDNYRCSISGSISANNLIKIAENIILK